MTIRKRLRILYALITQSWTTFRCPCGAESYIVGTAVALDGQLCEDCESREFHKWISGAAGLEAKRGR
jgi:hypothetical protein